jgi:type I protein arginine methyltransferase
MLSKSTSVTGNTTFSSLLFINECLLDEERTAAMRTAIHHEVKAGNIVLDAGTGSGILALFAAEAGARKVYAVDVDSGALSLARRGTGMSRFADKIEVVEADLKEFRSEGPMDVVIMEMLDTGLIAEEQASALNALRRHGAIDARTKVIPAGVRCSVEGVEYDFDFYGFSMSLTIQARNHGVQKRVNKALTDLAIYLDVDFGGPIDTTVVANVVLAIEHPGVLNALRLRTETILHAGCTIWETSDMNMPVIIPIEPRKVATGDRIEVSIRYIMGAGFDSFSVSVA